MAVKTAYLKQIKGITFAAKSDSNHWVTVDGSPEFGGSNAGSSPKELVLMGLAGCTSSDVINILNKKRVNLSDYEVNIKAEVSDEHPKVFTSINLEYVFYGKNINEKDVERAIELSQTKYCAVTQMLIKSVNITHTYKIIESD
jgi:putative redox protein